MIYLISLITLMWLSAFVYDYSAQYIKDMKVFDANKASIPIMAMYVTYHISYPIRKFIGIFR